jgi:hypothetical protein
MAAGAPPALPSRRWAWEAWAFLRPSGGDDGGRRDHGRPPPQRPPPSHPPEGNPKPSRPRAEPVGAAPVEPLGGAAPPKAQTNPGLSAAVLTSAAGDAARPCLDRAISCDRRHRSWTLGWRGRTMGGGFGTPLRTATPHADQNKVPNAGRGPPLVNQTVRHAAPAPARRADRRHSAVDHQGHRPRHLPPAWARRHRHRAGRAVSRLRPGARRLFPGDGPRPNRLCLDPCRDRRRRS